MYDETNITEKQEIEQTEEALPEKLFGEDSEVGTVGADHSVDTEKTQDTLRIKYNGEEKDITLDEARVLAQKGMNYDHVVAERDTKYQRELSALDKAAASRGLTREGFVKELEKDTAGEANQNNVPDAQNMSKRASEALKRIYDRVGLSGEWGKLFERYPDLPRANIREKLRDDIRSGMTPLEAYQAQLIRKAENEMKIRENNTAAAYRAVGSIESSLPARVRDEFLEGFSTID